MATEKVSPRGPRDGEPIPIRRVGTAPAAFAPFAGLCAVAAGIVGFAYALSFIVVSRAAPELGALLTALFLMLGGLLTTAALVGLYDRLRQSAPGFALWSLLLSVTGAFGSVVHGGYDLATTINPPGVAAGDLPSAIDPRGLLVFGVMGIAMLVFAWLIGRDRTLPRGLSYLGYASAVLLLALYLGRLIVLQATSPIIVVPAVLEGFIVNPVWYIWLGISLWRNKQL